MTKRNSPVSIDVGVGATASLEVQVSTEVPPASSGRLLDALTDLLRPISERRGLKADQIRLQREDVLIQIAEKARERIRIENSVITPVPNKFLVPFLEKASLEDPTSPLCEAWANLLVKAATDYHPKLNHYTDVLSRISAKEVGMLLSLALPSHKEGTSWPDGHYSENRKRTTALTKLLETFVVMSATTDEVHSKSLDAWVRFRKELTLKFGRVTHATVCVSRTRKTFYDEEIFSEDGLQIMVDILSRESLLEKRVLYFAPEHEIRLGENKLEPGSVGYIELTFLAFDLVKICTRNFTTGLELAGAR